MNETNMYNGMIWRIELQHHELDWISLIAVKPLIEQIPLITIDHTDALIAAPEEKLGLATAGREY